MNTDYDIRFILPVVDAPDIIGTDGDDLLDGNGANNSVVGLEGHDTLFGNGGDDSLYGDDGNDRLDGGEGNDWLEGGAGNDTYVITDADTIVEALNGGTDSVYSYLSTTLARNVENLTLFGDAISGAGNELDNGIFGNEGGNTLKGFAGNDTLSGGEGDDLLLGGAGRDFLTGGSGNDRFDFNAVGESALSVTDVIDDFDRGSDKISLSTIDANTKLAGNQAFKFIGQNDFSGVAGELQFLKSDNAGTSNDLTRVRADINGDGATDFQVTLKGLHNLTAADFEL